MKSEISIRFITYGQLCFYVGLALCFGLKPKGLTNNAGISYYGTLLITLVPYCVALLGSAYYFMRFSLLPEVAKYTIIKYAFISFGVLIIGLLLTPYTAGRFMADAHLTFGSTLFSLQLLLSGWFIVYLHWNPWVTLLTVLEFLGGLMSFIYLSPKHGYLTESQFIFQLCFNVLILYSLPRVLTNKSIAKS